MLLELFGKPFPTERKPSKCLTKKNKTGKEKQKKRGGEKAKSKRRGDSETFSKKKTILKFCFLCMPE